MFHDDRGNASLEEMLLAKAFHFIKGPFCIKENDE